jgi:hypothetical protein
VASGLTVIHDAIIKPADGFLGAVVDDVPTPVEVSVNVGTSDPSRTIDCILPTQPGYGDAGAIEDDAGYIQSAPQNIDQINKVFLLDGSPVNLYVALTVDPGPAVADDYAALTSGAVDLWLLVSVLP